MTQNNIKNHDTMSVQKAQLGANEQAILDQIPIPILRQIAESLVRLKMRLQFTGWLQYLLPMPFAILMILLSGLFALLNIGLLANLFGGVGLIVFSIMTFDIITVKFKIHLPEALPKNNEHLNTFDLMRARRSCRSFQTRKLTSEHYDLIMKSVQKRSAETTIGTSLIRFEYLSAPLTVWPTVNATNFLVAVAPKQYDRLAVIDIGRTLQKIVMDVTRLGLATCWIGPGADQSSIKQYLAKRFDPTQDHIICVCAIGYKSDYLPLFLRVFNRQFNQRLPLSSLFFADSQFDHFLNVNDLPFSKFGRTYEICQWSPSSYNGQTTRCVGFARTGQPLRFDFFASTASRYYAAVAVGIWCANWEMGCKEQEIAGHFEVLSPNESAYQQNQSMSQLPRYDVSWIAESRA